MAKTTINIDDNNEKLIKIEMNRTPLKKKQIVNIALDKYFNDISNRELLEEIRKLK